MRTKFLVMLLMLVSIGASKIVAQALTFDITNQTGVDLYGVYVSPEEENSWGDDLLPNDLFEAGTVVTVEIPADYGETCVFDIRVTTNEAEEEEIIFSGADLCKIESITLLEDGEYEVVWIDE